MKETLREHRHRLGAHPIRPETPTLRSRDLEVQGSPKEDGAGKSGTGGGEGHGASSPGKDSEGEGEAGDALDDRGMYGEAVGGGALVK